MAHRAWSLLAFVLATGCGTSRPPEVPVRPGIEVLLADSAHLIAGRRVGLITNQTGIDRDGGPDVERLVAAGVQLTTIFSPEHGYRGTRDDEGIGHGTDSATGLPVYSLYGATRSPTPEMLAAIDVLLIDLQDIGARPYTYVSTALLAMRAARASGVPVVILDRPNPIGGVLVQGPVLDTTFTSFAGMLPVPLRHGMTLGELARFGNDALGIGADLTVVPAAGWRRDLWFDETGLPWVRPSPSMPDLESATHYPGTVLFEATNLSVGRGTAVAFQVVGAPWLDAARLAEALSAMPGVECTDTTITPVAPPDGRYDGRTIPAVRLRATDRGRYDPVAAALALLTAVTERHADSLVVDTGRLARLAGTEAVWEAAQGHVSADSLLAAWRAGAGAFGAETARYRVYR